jgi:hypothetical protein
MTAQNPTTRKEPRKRIVWRRKSAVGKRIELYSSAYRIGWSQISRLQKREQPDIALRFHASVRRRLKMGAADPFVIASEALRANEIEPGTQ